MLNAEFPFLECTDDNTKMDLKANVYSSEHKMFFVGLTRCRGDGCKTDDEIDLFLEKKALFIAYNQQTYNPDLYGDETISNTLQLQYIAINTKEIVYVNTV